MADSTAAPPSTAVNHQNSIPQPGNPTPEPNSSSTTIPPNPNPNPNPNITSLPPPPSIHPSFRPADPSIPVQSAAGNMQFSQFGIPPPGVSTNMPPQFPGMMPRPYAMAPHQQMRPPYGAMPNGYPGIHQPFPQGAMPNGAPRYMPPYAPMMRPAFPPRPLIGVMPRPPIGGIRVPIIPIVRPPPVSSATSAEKPQTTVYVGKISSTVDNDFMQSLLQLCGPVKSWKRVQNPTDGTLKGFGFCEFESAEGVLRALRLLNKLSLDGQELMLNVNQATREYLEQYVQKKTENIKESETGSAEKEEQSASAADKNETSISTEPKKDESGTSSNENSDASLGLVTDEDRGGDREVLDKLSSMIEERLKNKPLPPPPPPPAPQKDVDASGNSNSEQRSRSRDRESDAKAAKNDSEDKNEASESTPSIEPVSPDRSRRKREKEREVERYERERDQERSKREKDREHNERRYKIREKDWESREKEREHWRKREREREKERAQERKRRVIEQERDSDSGRKRKHKSSDEDRKVRQREKKEDLADKLREEEEIEEAKMRAEEEMQKKRDEALESIMAGEMGNGRGEGVLVNEMDLDEKKGVDPTVECESRMEIDAGEVVSPDEHAISSNAPSDQLHNNVNAPSKKLGFGLSGFGKRTSVPSVFHEEEDEDAQKDKKMRPLVPIDYSTEEQQPEKVPSPNMTAAAAEFVKRISVANTKEERPEGEKDKEKEREKEKGRRSHERSSHRENRKDGIDRERESKSKTPENQKLLDAKQLIDTIPKTKDELFDYEINWAIYDQHALHERMRPWISKKITDFLGEEEVTLVDYIVSSTTEHVDAGEMLERLKGILDDEAEMFVLKMWRMLIFEIKKVKTGISRT